MRRHLLLLLSGAVAALSVGAGATLALFSAAAGPAQSTITAGTLSIQADRDDGDSTPGPMFYITAASGATPSAVPGLYPTGEWAPGDSHKRTLQVENVGTLDAKMTKVRAQLQSGSMYLANKLNVKVTADAAGTIVLAQGTLGDFINADQTFTAPVDAYVGDVINYWFWVEFPLNADNSYQGLSAVAAFEVYAEQLDNNP